MLEQIVREVSDERIVSPLFSGPMFNNMNNANRMGGGMGGGMGEPTSGPDYSYGPKRQVEQLTPSPKFTHGYDMPGTKAQFHVHEDENGLTGTFKDYNRKRVGPILNGYETAMADHFASAKAYLKKIGVK